MRRQKLHRRGKSEQEITPSPVALGLINAAHLLTLSADLQHKNTPVSTND